MRLEEATDVFCESFAFTRSFRYPFEVVRVGGLRILRDAVPKRHPRTQEVIVCGLQPEAAVREIEAQKLPRHFVCVAVEPGTDRDALRRSYRALGYRALSTETFFVRDLSLPIAPVTTRVSRVETKEQALHVAKVARQEQLPSKYLNCDAVRLYAACENGEPVGWVRSIHAVPDSTWVSGLYVLPEWRHHGIGRALMTKLLEEDQRSSALTSVLLASKAGSMLYPKVGYEEIGSLLIFSTLNKPAA